MSPLLFQDAYQILSKRAFLPDYVRQACMLTEESYQNIYRTLSARDGAAFESAREYTVTHVKHIPTTPAEEVDTLCALVIRNLKLIRIYELSFYCIGPELKEEFFQFSHDEKWDLLEKLWPAWSKLRGHQYRAFFHLISQVPRDLRAQAVKPAFSLASRCVNDECAKMLLQIEVPVESPVEKLSILEKVLDSIVLEGDTLWIFEILGANPFCILSVEPLLYPGLRFTRAETEELFTVIRRNWNAYDPDAFSASLPLVSLCVDSFAVAKIVDRVATLPPILRKFKIPEVTALFPKPVSSAELYQGLLKVVPDEPVPEALQLPKVGLDMVRLVRRFDKVHIEFRMPHDVFMAAAEALEQNGVQ